MPQANRSGAINALMADALVCPRRQKTGREVGTVAQPVKVDNDLYVRDYAKCIFCYQCVDARGEQWQNSFVIGIAGSGLDARVYPTGALMFTSEHDMRAAGTWDEDAQTTSDAICAFCGVGCNPTLHVQDNTIVKVTSPTDSPITHGNLCIKGRFGFQHAQNRP